MSLYGTGEVCGTCPHATLHSCGRCLISCALGLEHDELSGTCSGYAGSNESVLRRMHRRDLIKDPLKDAEKYEPEF